jgi:hypothetical protein
MRQKLNVTLPSSLDSSLAHDFVSMAPLHRTQPRATGGAALDLRRGSSGGRTMLSGDCIPFIVEANDDYLYPPDEVRLQGQMPAALLS